jgi:transcriptional regulator with XRE-family HTH domain
MRLVMAKKSTKKAPGRTRADAETIGQRLARLRRERGLTQVMLAERVGIIQALVSDYERDKLRLNPDMSVKFAQALGVTTDQLLGLQPTKGNGHQPSRKVLRRLQEIENLPRRDQDALLRTIDAFLAKSAA